MAITAVTPASGSTIAHGDSVSFTIDDTYTSLVIKAQSETALEKVYDTALSGGQAGYTTTVVDNGDGTHTVTFSRDAGWDKHPQLIYVTEDETGSSATTNLSFNLNTQQAFPQATEPTTPVNSTIIHGAIGGLTADDHPQYHNDTRGDARYSLLAHTHDHGTITGLGDDDHTQYHNDTRGDARYPRRIDGSGAPGVSTGNGYPLGTVYVDTTADAAYTLADATTDANVWASASGVTDHGALTGLSDDDHPIYHNDARGDVRYPRRLDGAGAPGVSTGNGYALGTVYADTTNDVGYILVDATTDANIWSLAVSDHGALTGLGDDDHTQYAQTAITGAGVPGVATGNGYRLGTIYVDTTADEAYTLADNTTGANVWDRPSGGGGGGPNYAFQYTQIADVAGNPAAGQFRVATGASGTPSGITRFRFNPTDADSILQTSILSGLGSGNYIKIWKDSDPTEWYIYRMTQASQVVATWDMFVSHVGDSGGTFDQSGDWNFHVYSGQNVQVVSSTHSYELSFAANLNYHTYNLLTGHGASIISRDLGTTTAGVGIDARWGAFMAPAAGELLDITVAGYSPVGGIGSIGFRLFKAVPVLGSTTTTNTDLSGFDLPLTMNPANAWSGHLGLYAAGSKTLAGGDMFGFICRRTSSFAPQSAGITVTYRMITGV